MIPPPLGSIGHVTTGCVCWEEKIMTLNYFECVCCNWPFPGRCCANIILSGVFKEEINSTSVLGRKTKHTILQWVLMSSYMRWLSCYCNPIKMASSSYIARIKGNMWPIFSWSSLHFLCLTSDQWVSQPKRQRYRALINPRKEPQTLHVHVQIPLISIVCYLSCHSNVLLQTVLTNKLQKSRQIDRHSVCRCSMGEQQ